MKKRALFLFIVTNLCFTPPAHAQTSGDYGIEISRKFGRGLLNVLSSPLELPCEIRDEVSEWGWRGIFTGPVQGVALFARRLLVGVTEVATFVIPMEGTLAPVCQKKPEPVVQTT